MSQMLLHCYRAMTYVFASAAVTELYVSINGENIIPFMLGVSLEKVVHGDVAAKLIGP